MKLHLRGSHALYKEEIEFGAIIDERFGW